MLLIAVAGWSFAEAIPLFLVADIAISIVAVRHAGLTARQTDTEAARTGP